MVKSTNKAGRKILLACFFMAEIIYLYWRTAYTIPFGFGVLALCFGILLLTAEFAGFIDSLMFYTTLSDISTPSTPKVNGEYPHVDVFVATYNEPADLLYKTIVGCKNMDYPDKERVHIYVCDDGRREEIKNLCDKLRVNYLKRENNLHAKAGNLNNALKYSSSPYVVTFDADMIPMHDFLTATVPFFMENDNVGFVQVPQNFYNLDPFQYNLFSESTIPNEQELFSRMIQAGKMKHNAIIYAGSNTVISRKALDEIGGFVTGTITEDIATGMKIQANGYKSVYLNEIHASGLSPESLEDLYNQRVRWGRGVVQTFRAQKHMFNKKLKIMQKLMYSSALSYWYFGIWRMIFFMAPIMYSVFGITVLTTNIWGMLIFWLPMFALSSFTFKVFSNGIRTTTWAHIYDTIMFPQVTIGVLMETFGVKMEKFKVTPKENVTRRRFTNKFRLVRIQIVLGILSIIGVVRVVADVIMTHQIMSGYTINLFWLGYNSYILAMSVFFASERPKLRSTERLMIKAAAKVRMGRKFYRGTTKDISESGVSIEFTEPFYMNTKEEVQIKIKDGRYFVDLLGEVVNVSSRQGKYVYAFKFAKMPEYYYQHLLMLLYDREPNMQHTVKTTSFMSNISKNLKQRRHTLVTMNRKLPRIAIDRNVLAIINDKYTNIKVSDYNYECLSVITRKNASNLELLLGDGQSMFCELNERLSMGNKKVYRILNYESFIYSNIKELLNYDTVKLKNRYEKMAIGQVSEQRMSA